MRTVGLGWRQFETKWTFFSDERQHTIEALRRMLLNDILPHERSLQRLKRLPRETALPELKCTSIKSLGTADAEALKIESQSLFAVDNLLVKALEARRRGEAAGISDSVEAVQPQNSPPLDTSLVGKSEEA